MRLVKVSSINMGCVSYMKAYVLYVKFNLWLKNMENHPNHTEYYLILKWYILLCFYNFFLPKFTACK